MGHVHIAATSCFSAVSRSCNAPRPPAFSISLRIGGGRNSRSVHSMIAAVCWSSFSNPSVDGRNCATTSVSAFFVIAPWPARSDFRSARRPCLDVSPAQLPLVWNRWHVRRVLCAQLLRQHDELCRTSLPVEDRRADMDFGAPLPT